MAVILPKVYRNLEFITFRNQGRLSQEDFIQEIFIMYSHVIQRETHLLSTLRIMVRLRCLLREILVMQIM